MKFYGFWLVIPLISFLVLIILVLRYSGWNAGALKTENSGLETGQKIGITSQDVRNVTKLTKVVSCAVPETIEDCHKQCCDMGCQGSMPKSGDCFCTDSYPWPMFTYNPAYVRFVIQCEANFVCINLIGDTDTVMQQCSTVSYGAVIWSPSCRTVPINKNFVKCKRQA